MKPTPKRSTNKQKGQSILRSAYEQCKLMLRYQSTANDAEPAEIEEKEEKESKATKPIKKNRLITGELLNSQTINKRKFARTLEDIPSREQALRDGLDILIIKYTDDKRADLVKMILRSWNNLRSNTNIGYNQIFRKRQLNGGDCLHIAIRNCDFSTFRTLIIADYNEFERTSQSSEEPRIRQLRPLQLAIELYPTQTEPNRNSLISMIATLSTKDGFLDYRDADNLKNFLQQAIELYPTQTEPKRNSLISMITTPTVPNRHPLITIITTLLTKVEFEDQSHADILEALLNAIDRVGEILDFTHKGTLQEYLSAISRIEKNGSNRYIELLTRLVNHLPQTPLSEYTTPQLERIKTILEMRISHENSRFLFDYLISIMTPEESARYQLIYAADYNFISKLQTIGTTITILDLNAASTLKQSFTTARNEFTQWLSLPDDSALGIENGRWSKLRHTRLCIRKSEPDAILGEVLTINDNWRAFDYCCKQIKSNGSLYDLEKGDNHSFTNFFLIQLLQISTPIYRRVVGSAYGISFVEGAITLYRRDKRPPREIFKEGFCLKNSENLASMRKKQYSDSCSFAAGISCSFKIPPKDYGRFLYFIKLHENHNLLLINILQSHENSTSPSTTQYQKELMEVNSIGSIHSRYIEQCFDQGVASDETYHYNNGYNPNPTSHLHPGEHGVF